MQEFKLIQENFFKISTIANQSDVPINFGMGDDCAVFAQNIAISHDTLNQGIHFFKDDSPENIASKAFAVNLSDLAAMAAQPIAFLLALSLPAELSQNDAWLNRFSQTLHELAQKHHCPLIGGDTTRGEYLSIGISILGKVSQSIPYRHRAKMNDDIWITGPLGQARLALEHHLGNLKLTQKHFLTCQNALYCPPARINLMQELAPFIHAAIDISDGLASDLTHILKASKLSAKLCIEAFEIAPALLENVPNRMMPSLLLNAGDDYEICFTAPAQARDVIKNISEKHGINCQRVGTCLEKSKAINTDLEVNYHQKKLNIDDLKGFSGFQHF